MKIQHDFHIHTVYSSDTDQTATVKNYFQIAKRRGLKKIGFAEHFWDDGIDGAFPFYRALTFDHVSQTKTEIEKYADNDIKLYFGCEVEYDPTHKSPALTEAVAERFDFVVVPHSHSHETMPKECYDPPQKHLDFIVEAYENIINSNVSRYVTAMAHPFALVRCPYSRDVLIDMMSDDAFSKLFYKTANKGIAIEINTSSVFSSNAMTNDMERSAMMRMFRLAKECGCRFIFGSDSHCAQHLEEFSADAQKIVDYLNLCENDILDIAK